MGRLEDIEKAVSKLSPTELLEFRAWFEEFEAARFDARIERDVAKGALDDLAAEAIASLREGRAREV
jgi:hypothetical protein